MRPDFASMDSIVLDSITAPRFLITALALGVGLFAAPAEAHIELLSPQARYSSDHQKSEPCGAPGNPPGEGPVATYQAGETITIQFDEFVDHGGHFRVALDPTGTDAFTSPTGFQDFYNSPEVLLDEIPDGPGGMYSIDVTLPDAPCNPCTLQLIQVMNDGTWGPGTSDLYFQCSDIVIEGSAAETGSDTSGADGTGGEESTGGGGDVGSTGSDPDDGPADSEGESTGGAGSEGTGEGTGDTGLATGSSGPADDDDDASGCSCRTESSTPAAAAPWLLVALVAWRRRRG